MINLLYELQNKGSFVSIYTNDENTSKFIFGKILCVNNSEIAIYMLSPDGSYDGILVTDNSKIFRIETNSDYNKKMQKLCNFEELPVCYEFKNNENIKKELLYLAHKTKQAVSIELLNSGYDDVVGIVENIGDNICTISQINQYGKPDGVSFVSMQDITQISYNSQDEIIIMRLIG